MKSAAPFNLLIAGMLVAGCVAQKSVFNPASAAAVPPSVIVTPENSPAGKVLSYNSGARFVVLNFPNGQMPGMGQKLFLYRNGLKVAEVQITGPQMNGNIVADLTAGGARVGDEVRDQ